MAGKVSRAEFEQVIADQRKMRERMRKMEQELQELALLNQVEGLTISSENADATSAVGEDWETQYQDHKTLAENLEEENLRLRDRIKGLRISSRESLQKAKNMRELFQNQMAVIGTMQTLFNEQLNQLVAPQSKQIRDIKYHFQEQTQQLNAALDIVIEEFVEHLYQLGQQRLKATGKELEPIETVGPMAIYVDGHEKHALHVGDYVCYLPTGVFGENVYYLDMVQEGQPPEFESNEAKLLRHMPSDAAMHCLTHMEVGYLAENPADATKVLLDWLQSVLVEIYEELEDKTSPIYGFTR